jgi:alpha/beta superfamily hydrolase|tara:strand:+ start:33 stop:689 length:657 start_codon:yes stop_codon:yes gene_type:complete
MKQKSLEVFIPGPSGRLEGKYFKSTKQGSPVAIVLHPHPQYGGTMNNRVVQETFNTFVKNGFSVLKFNFRGVDKSEGTFDNGQGELSDAAAALDWVERENQDYSQCWVSGFSFGSLICMQLIMRRPEVTKFICIAPQPNVYDFTFLAPCPTSGQIVFGENDELVPKNSIDDLKNRLLNQKNVDVNFSSIKGANHFFKSKEEDLKNIIDKYIKEKTELI